MKILNLDEDELLQILSEFSCPVNPDVEKFLKCNSVDFTKKNQSVTYLVFSAVGGKLLGYFILALKSLTVRGETVSNTVKKKLYEALAKKARYFKQDEKGVAAMCKILEDMRNEAAQKAAQEAAQKANKKTAAHLIKLGKMTLEEIAEATELSLDAVKELESQSMQLA